MERAPSLKSAGDERTSREPTPASLSGDGKDGLKPSRPPCRFFLLVSVIGSVPRIVRFDTLFFQCHEKLKLERNVAERFYGGVFYESRRARRASFVSCVYCDALEKMKVSATLAFKNWAIDVCMCLFSQSVGVISGLTSSVL